MAEATHLLDLPLKHKPKDIKPQGSGSGLDADKVDGLHASELGGGGPHAAIHETGGGDKVHFADLERGELDATLHDAFTGTPHISQTEKDKIHDRLHALDSTLDHSGVITDAQHGTKTTIPDAHHRKWSWADEQGWNREIVVPLTGKRMSPGGGGGGGWTRIGQVLGLGASGTWDALHVEPASALKVGNEIFLYYTGRNSTGTYRCGLATSVDPKGTFTRYAGNPIIDLGGAGAPDEVCAACPTVVYDRAENIFKLWYIGASAAWANRYLCYATSNDGKSWTKRSPPNVYTFPGSPSTDWGPVVIKVGKYYFCGYRDGTSGNIYLLASNDGINWTNEGSILSLGSAGQWDDTNLNYIGLFWNLGIWYLTYTGRNSAGNSGVGMATSVDGFNFTKWRYNPIYYNSASGFDSQRVYWAILLMIDDVFYMYYGGFNGVNITIGVATLP